MSLILPYSGVTAVDAIRYAVISHGKRCTSPRSRPMVGRALARMVESSEPMNTGSRMPHTICWDCLWVSGAGLGVAASIDYHFVWYGRDRRVGPGKAGRPCLCDHRLGARDRFEPFERRGGARHIAAPRK